MNRKLNKDKNIAKKTILRQRHYEEPLPEYFVIKGVGTPNLIQTLKAREINQVINDSVGVKFLFDYTRIKCVKIKDETVAKIGPVIDSCIARKLLGLTTVKHFNKEYKLKIERDWIKNKSEGVIVDWNNMFEDMNNEEIA